MNLYQLSQLSPDLFIEQITHLPFRDVVKVCNLNRKLRGYCNLPQYNTRWKALTNRAFENVIYNYDNKLIELWKELNIKPNTYNYLVYTQLVKLLDPVTQGMIYYRQGDMELFEQLTEEQKFLAMFLLGQNDKIKLYLPRDYYLPFVRMLNGDKVNQDDLDMMLRTMASEGNMKGLKYFEKKGANLHALDDEAMREASSNGQLVTVKYLIEHGANLRVHDDYALRYASIDGHLDVVKYLVEHGADIHARDDEALTFANEKGHLDVVKYLISVGADPRATLHGIRGPVKNGLYPGVVTIPWSSVGL